MIYGKKAKAIIIDEMCNITPEQIEACMEHTKGIEPAEFKKEYEGTFEPEPGPPQVLSLDANSKDFQPCYVRVGVRIDGVERNDIAYYNCKNLSYMTERKTSHLATTIDPYWRFSESRQQRRARERWETKHGR